MQSPPEKYTIEIKLPPRLYMTIGILIGIAMLLTVAWNLAGLLTILFSSVLLAVPIRSATTFLIKKLRFPSVLALLVVLVLLIVSIGGGIWLLAEPVSEQFQMLAEVLPKSVDLLIKYLDEFEWSRDLLNQLLRWENLISNQFSLIDRAMLIFSNTIGMFISLLIIILLSVYLAADPDI